MTYITGVKSNINDVCGPYYEPHTSLNEWI